MFYGIIPFPKNPPNIHEIHRDSPISFIRMGDIKIFKQKIFFTGKWMKQYYFFNYFLQIFINNPQK